MIKLQKLTTSEEADMLDEQFAKRYGWYLRGEYYRRCLEENQAKRRVTLMAFINESLAGCCHLLYRSNYSFFQEEGIPEINDLNVFQEYRRKRVASRLLDELETIASETSRFVGIGVGLYADYGNAQRMYTSRGYVLDGRGLMYRNVPVQPGQLVNVDDDLILYLVKDLKNDEQS